MCDIAGALDPGELINDARYWPVMAAGDVVASKARKPLVIVDR
jgi:hypothetical protein